MKVLIALDQSVISLRAAHAAVGLFPGADTEFLVINVAPLPTPWAYSLGYGAVGAVASYDLLAQSGLDESEITTRAERAGVEDPDVLTDIGDPVSCICSAAETHDVDVVVVGSHDKGIIARLLEPSVAAGVIRGTYRPVLVVSGEPPAAAN